MSDVDNKEITRCKNCKWYSIFCYCSTGYLCKATEILPNTMIKCKDLNDGNCKFYEDKWFIKIWHYITFKNIFRSQK